MADLYVVQIFRVVGASVFADASVSWATEDVYMSVFECFFVVVVQVFRHGCWDRLNVALDLMCTFFCV